MYTATSFAWLEAPTRADTAGADVVLAVLALRMLRLYCMLLVNVQKLTRRK
jgi:hypothetical protein